MSKKKDFIAGNDEADFGVDNNTIEEIFKNEQQSTQAEVKEIFNEDKVKARTDISRRQIKLITKAYYFAKLVNMPEVNLLLKDFLTLSISKDRKSRAEYVEGLKARIDNDIARSGLNLRGQFGK